MLLRLSARLFFEHLSEHLRDQKKSACSICGLSERLSEKGVDYLEIIFLMKTPKSKKTLVKVINCIATQGALKFRCPGPLGPSPQGPALSRDQGGP